MIGNKNNLNTGMNLTHLLDDVETATGIEAAIAADKQGERVWRITQQVGAGTGSLDRGKAGSQETLRPQPTHLRLLMKKQDSRSGHRFLRWGSVRANRRPNTLRAQQAAEWDSACRMYVV